MLLRVTVNPKDKRPDRGGYLCYQFSAGSEQSTFSGVRHPDSYLPLGLPKVIGGVLALVIALSNLVSVRISLPAIAVAATLMKRVATVSWT
jgi:hypothetical protein